MNTTWWVALTGQYYMQAVRGSLCSRIYNTQPHTKSYLAVKRTCYQNWVQWNHSNASLSLTGLQGWAQAFGTISMEEGKSSENKKMIAWSQRCWLTGTFLSTKSNCYFIRSVGMLRDDALNEMIRMYQRGSHSVYSQWHHITTVLSIPRTFQCQAYSRRLVQRMPYCDCVVIPAW